VHSFSSAFVVSGPDFLAEQAYFSQLAMQEEYDHLLELIPARQ